MNDKVLHSIADAPGEYIFWCPGCKCAHAVWTEAPNARTGAKWGFNEDMDKPTFSPSILVTYRHPTGYSNDNPAPAGYNGPFTEDRCHMFVKNGMIEFLSDCTHELRGKTVPLEPF